MMPISTMRSESGCCLNCKIRSASKFSSLPLRALAVTAQVARPDDAAMS